MLESIVESRQRTIRGNRTLIVLRLLFATISLAILLLQESLSVHSQGSRHIQPNSGEVTALDYSVQDKMLCSGGSDATVRLWDDAGDERITSLEGHGDIVRDVAVSPDGTKVASVSDDKTLRLTGIANGKLLGAASLSDPGSRSAAWSADGSRIVVCGGDATLRVLSGTDAALIKDAGEAGRNLAYACFLPGDKEIVSVSLDGVIQIWDEHLTPGEPIRSPFRTVLAGAQSPDHRWLVFGGHLIGVMDLASRSIVRVAEIPDGHVNALGFSADNKHFASGGSDRRILLWSVEQPRELKALTDQDEVLAVALWPDASRVASGTGDKVVRVWDFATGASKQLVGHKPALRNSYWQADSRAKRPAVNVPLYWRPEGLVVVIVCLLTILYILALRTPQIAPKLAYLQILVDVGLVSALVYHTGGVDSPFVTLYLVSVVAGGFVLSWRGALMVAALAATLFSLLTLMYGLGQIPETYMTAISEAQLRKFKTMGLLDYVRLLLLPICAFFLVALLAGNLSKRLAVTRMLHHEVLEGIGEGILVADLERKMLYHNREFEKLLLIKEDIAGKSLGELLGPQVDEAAGKALEELVSRRVEISNKRSDGMIMPFEVRLIPVLEDDGKARGLILVLDDITAEKKMEEFFKHKERIEAMGQLSATIAHEIRNPLASIRGAVQEIARSVEIPESKKILVDIVLSESDRLDQIISDFLRYARMRPPKLGSVEIGQVLTDMRMMLIARPEAKETEIKLDEQEDVKPFLADAEQLRQVFLNLGVNALQAMAESKERRLTLSVRPLYLHQAQGLDPKAVIGRVDRPGVWIEIRDTGQGMPEEVSRQIFEPFFTTKPNGTGLGLAIVARIVQAHEGLINVESQQGKGTAFSIWLPTDRAASETAGTAAAGAARSLA